MVPAADPPVPGRAGRQTAAYGDPLHDLATHLVRTRYPEARRGEVFRTWTQAVSGAPARAADGLEGDLRRHVDFEWAQSVYWAVMHTARYLATGPDPEAYLGLAASSLHRALRTAAADPVPFTDPPDRPGVPLVPHARQAAGHTVRRPWFGRRGAAALPFVPDPRVPERADFPHDLVGAVLAAEDRASADHVFRGTAHRNTVVSAPGFGAVLVRRDAAPAHRHESVFTTLEEYPVLRAIEEAGVEVAAPRVLARGQSEPAEPFAVLTYLGPLPGEPAPDGRPCVHPVEGLLPHEADLLVDQLCALTALDCATLDPLAAHAARDFHPWLADRVATMVAGLPERTLLAARRLGLPDAPRLAELLARHRVTPRRPALLHGDLNPWNLVRTDDPRHGTGLALIDWEMALIGDPLHDLVRHLHLTPARSEIRHRMFARWEERVGPEHSRGWQRDRRVYQLIEIVRSAYVDLDRIVHGMSLDVPAVRQAADRYAHTLKRTTRLLDAA
ncbi:phosphotransferase family protein [Streptomyces sp. NPDC089424]|uniref:phosphotransferase family protein n=1 Tax=Streptomyces sp. NPDC089424 TaxID=3365917 RepID=UPI0037F99A1B